jgi:hypothetical protein
MPWTEHLDEAEPRAVHSSGRVVRR